jgi:hypothetical protein
MSALHNACQNGEARRKALRKLQPPLWLRTLRFLYTCLITACMVLVMLGTLLVALDAPLDPPAPTQTAYRRSI